jgi:hypothetical protein
MPSMIVREQENAPFVYLRVFVCWANNFLRQENTADIRRQSLEYLSTRLVPSRERERERERESARREMRRPMSCVSSDL